MDVRRAVDDALVEDEVHEADDRRRVRRRLHRRDVVRVRVRERVVVRHALAELLDHVRDGLVRVAVVLRDAGHHVRLAREDEADLLRQREKHLVGDARVDEVERRERHRRVVVGDGEDVVHARGRGGDRVGHVRLERHVREVDGLGVLVGGHERQQVVFAQDLLVDDEAADRLAFGLGDVLDLLGGVLVKVAVLHEQLENRIEHSSTFLSPAFQSWRILYHNKPPRG